MGLVRIAPRGLNCVPRRPSVYQWCLADHSFQILCPTADLAFRGTMVELFRQLRAADIGKFRFVQDDPCEVRIDFRGDDCVAFLGNGWHGPPGGEWLWSDKEAELHFAIGEAWPSRVRMLASTYGAQRIHVL